MLSRMGTRGRTGSGNGEFEIASDANPRIGESVHQITPPP